MEETLESKFKWALDRFDFEKVRKVMTYLDWEWFTSNGMETPSVEQMKDCCRELFEHIDITENDTWSSGGFSVGKHGDNIQISFVVEEKAWESV